MNAERNLLIPFRYLVAWERFKLAVSENWLRLRDVKPRDEWTLDDWNLAFDEAMRWRDWQTCETLFAERETESWWPAEKAHLNAMPDPPGAGWQE